MERKLLHPGYRLRAELPEGEERIVKTWCAVALVAAITATSLSAQKTESDKAAERQNREAGPGEAPNSTLDVKPGPPTIKTKDIEQDRKITPWKRLPRYILRDQRGIWTSPFHTSKADAKWWAIFGGATAVLIATDKWTSKQLPNTRDQIAVATWTSRLGAGYSLIPISGAFYFIGLGANNERFRETGILGFEAVVNAEIVDNVMKLATRRERPLEGNGNGRFWSEKSTFWNAGFPSGHAISSWALASVVAHEYPRPLIVPIVAYGLATTVCASRFAVRKHFASDIVLGGSMGWFIGDYVYAKRHNRDLDKKESAI
jgi:membrane-associated phospholipid phosphatase